MVSPLSDAQSAAIACCFRWCYSGRRVYLVSSRPALFLAGTNVARLLTRVPTGRCARKPPARAHAPQAAPGAPMSGPSYARVRARPSYRCWPWQVPWQWCCAMCVCSVCVQCVCALSVATPTFGLASTRRRPRPPASCCILLLLCYSNIS